MQYYKGDKNILKSELNAANSLTCLLSKFTRHEQSDTAVHGKYKMAHSMLQAKSSIKNHIKSVAEFCSQTPTSKHIS